MNPSDKYHGVMPAFYACYDENGAVSPSRAKLLARYLCDQGVAGLYVGGSSGECIYLSPDERELILEAVVEEVGKEIIIIAHVACNNTKDSMRLAAHAEQLGVDAIAAIPPIYFRLPEPAIAQYWNDISSAAPNTDFLIYNIPQLAGVALTENLYREMLKNPRVIGVKNSSMATMDIERFKAIDQTRVIFNGPDEQYISGRIMGASGGIGGTYAAMVKLFLSLDSFLERGDLSQATALQSKITDIIMVCAGVKGNLYAALKAVLKIRAGLELGSVRKPLLGLQEGDYEQVQRAAAMIDDAERQYVSPN